MIDKLYRTARLRPHWLVFTLGLCLLSLTTSAQQFPFLSKKKQERRIAFIIGNNTYQNLPELHTPINDAKAIKARLQQLGFAVKMLADADSSNLSLSLKSIQDTLQENDVVFFYFSGYGINKNKTNYILPIDAELNPLKNTILLKGIKDSLSSKKVKYCFMVLDANRELFDVERLGIHSGFVQDTSTSKSSNVLSVFAAKEGNLSNEQQDFQNSTFSASLIKYLGKVNTGIRTVLDSTINDVSSKTTGLQTPVKYDEIGKDIQLIQASRPARTSLKILVGSVAITTGLTAFVLNNNYQNKKEVADGYYTSFYNPYGKFQTFDDYTIWQKAYNDALQARKKTLVNTLIATSALAILYESYLLFFRSPQAVRKKLQDKGLSFSPAQQSLGMALRYTF